MSTKRFFHLGWATCLAASTFAVYGQTATNQVRQITLGESIQMALRDNLGLQILRLNPQLSLLNVEIAKAGYDPILSMSGEHSYNTSGGGRDPNTNLRYAPSTTEDDNFGAGISGVAPTGLRYDLFANVNDRYGEAPEFDQATTNFFLSPFEDSRGQVGINLAQPLLRNFLIDNTRYAIALSKNEVKFSDSQLQNQLIILLTAVEQAYYELIFSRENLKVQEEGLRLAQQLLADNRKRVQVGILSPLDEKQSESEAFARQADVSTARQALSTAQNTLKRLITSNYRELHGVDLQPSEALTAVPQKFDLMESWSSGLTRRPDLVQARLDLDRQGIELKYTKNQRLPQLDVTGSYGYSAGGDAINEFSDAFQDIASQDKPFWSVGAVIGVPLSNKAARERYRRSKLVADQLVLNLKDREELAMVEIDQAITSIRTTLDTVTSRRQARIYAEQSLDAGQKRLQAGTATSFEVLQLQRDLISARSLEIRAMADYNRSIADLYRAEGTTLDRKKIAIEVK